MKHARDDYNHRIVDVFQIIPRDEPVFLIRGQDVVGAEAVRAWAKLAAGAGADDKIVAMAFGHADRMAAWAEEKGKVPDLPDPRHEDDLIVADCSDGDPDEEEEEED